MIPKRLRTKFISSINYIEKISDVTVDVKLLLNEAKILDSQHWMDSFTQTKICVQENNLWMNFTENMTYTKSVIDNLKKYMPFNSVYYRYVKPLTCYNWHVDIMSTCLHIPLTTNFGCKFVYEDAVFTMPADGSVYMVNNSKPHTFINAGNEPRLHITMDIFLQPTVNETIS